MAVKRANSRKRTSEKHARGRGKPAAAQPTTIPVCARCGAKCCHDLVIPIDKPKTATDVEEMRWELQYDCVSIFIRSHRWYRLIHARCIYLDENNRCTIYDRRPKRCREMKPPDCEHYGQFYEVMLNTPEELEAYLQSRRQRRRVRRAPAKRR